jgi:hypothetical protein
MKAPLFPSNLLTAHEPTLAGRVTPVRAVVEVVSPQDRARCRVLAKECGSPLPLMPQTAGPRESREITHNFAASQSVSQYHPL